MGQNSIRQKSQRKIKKDRFEYISTLTKDEINNIKLNSLQINFNNIFNGLNCKKINNKINRIENKTNSFIEILNNSISYSLFKYKLYIKKVLNYNNNINIIQYELKKNLSLNKYDIENLSEYEDISNNVLLKKYNNNKSRKNEIIIRNKYYLQLITKQIWKPKEVINKNLFFFDWDDTLMCTSFIFPSGILLDKYTEKDKENLKKLDLSVKNILTKTIELGDVYLISNAAPGWIEFSSNKFYPNSVELLKKVKIISARGLFEKKYPGDMKQWKVKAFLKIFEQLNPKLLYNIICFGDSIMELEASHVLASKLLNVYIKTIKFKQSPKPIEITKQLNLILKQFNNIYGSVKNLSIKIENK
jgi:hypothetical protein